MGWLMGLESHLSNPLIEKEVFPLAVDLHQFVVTPKGDTTTRTRKFGAKFIMRLQCAPAALPGVNENTMVWDHSVAAIQPGKHQPTLIFQVAPDHV